MTAIIKATAYTWRSSHSFCNFRNLQYSIYPYTVQKCILMLLIMYHAVHCTDLLGIIDLPKNNDHQEFVISIY